MLEEQPVKRKRGRPRKDSSVPPTDLMGVQSRQEVTQQADSLLLSAALDEGDIELGRPPRDDYERKQVYKHLEAIKGWVAHGTEEKDIASMLGVTEKTLKKWRKAHPELDKAFQDGEFFANGRLIQSAFKLATGFYYDEITAQKRRDEEYDPSTKKKTSTEYIELVKVRKYQPPNYNMAKFLLSARLGDMYKEYKPIEPEAAERNIQIVSTIPAPGEKIDANAFLEQPPENLGAEVLQDAAD